MNLEQVIKIIDEKRAVKLQGLEWCKEKNYDVLERDFKAQIDMLDELKGVLQC